jgi:menaquinone-dependent protoporphyrinogen oxidase
VGRNLVSAETMPASRVGFLESRCGEKRQHPKILVAYASRCGSTGGVAGAIAGTFCDAGASVDVLRVENVPNLKGYHGVVVGSAIHSDQWLPEALDFVERHGKDLSGLPVAYFLTCLTLVRNTEENRKKALGFMTPLRRKVPGVTPVDTGLFSGVLAYDKLSFMVRMVMKMKMQDKGVAEGDYRDWEAIKAWAGSVFPALTTRENGARIKAS